ncbi:DUF1203 domain-containing protein [Hoeflea alexandrii]|uniref:DUF1203 domain-containing protein n=1 Tax=Hoeflea alexandrii TaxID=288436 RepID=UPI002D1E4098|nr:DUF1203 domain-containing protein [Hoeflea alexandrii]
MTLNQKERRHEHQVCCPRNRDSPRTATWRTRCQSTDSPAGHIRWRSHSLLKHCLSPVAKGEEYLILSHRPFPRAQPYAESGPIFLHARECERAADTHDAAPMFTYGRAFILRGYRNNDWINYDAAEVVTPDKIEQTAKRLLERDDVAYVHMRSSQMNCYQCRIERA